MAENVGVAGVAEAPIELQTHRMGDGMSSLIVIRIIPEQPVDAATFTKFLKPSLGPLQITAFDLSFSDPTVGKAVGTAIFLEPTTGPSPTSDTIPLPQPPLQSPQYSSPPTSAIIQQYDVEPQSSGDAAYFKLQSVATAIIEVPTGTNVKNLRIAAQWGSGASATPVPVALDFYDVAVFAAPPPDLNAWNPTPPAIPGEPSVPDPWGALLPPNVYLQIPVPPGAASSFSFQLPSDGTPPPFDQLLNAIQQMLAIDPGPAVTVATTTAAAAGALGLQLPAGTAGVIAGMSVTGAGVASGTVVTAIDATGLLGLTEETNGPVPSGTPLTFVPNLGALSLDQCRNIAYEIVWSQQPAVPNPPDPVEELYSNPPNNGGMLTSAGSGFNPNPLEADRQQFEAKLKAYYTLADATANRLTNFVFALSAAVACEQRSLAATEIVLELPVGAGSGSGGSLSGATVLLAGIDTVASPTHAGVPAAYFYGLTALLPPQIAPPQRYALATSDRLDRLLVELTSAINSGFITDQEKFVLAAPADLNAAQAARRMAALGTATATSSPLAPLGTFALPTLVNVASGEDLQFASTAGLKAGMSVSGVSIAPGTTLASLTATSVKLSVPVLGNVHAGNMVVFIPPYTASLTALVGAWLDFPASTGGTPSSQTYQDGDDDTQLWPVVSAADPDAFLNLVLCALTEGFIIPAPFSVALGEMITLVLLSGSPTVAGLEAVTVQQWSDFFQKNPTWLPPGNGNAAARLAEFIRRVQTFFVLSAGGPSAPFVLVTTAFGAPGTNVLDFATTTAVFPGMSVSGTNLPPGTAVAPAGVGPTSVTLTQSILAPGVPINSNITFSVVISAAAVSDIPVFGAPSQDWFAACLSAVGPFTLGSGFDPVKLKAAAAKVFPGDEDAQSWIIDALVTLDALYRVMKSVALPPPATPALEFSFVEALYARGFKSAAQMTELTGDQFEQALVGTIAFDTAGLIYSSASAIAPPSAATSGGGSFHPVNPDGALTNCIPPPCTSPLGPVAYLSELLQLSELSTCDTPFATPLSLAIATTGDVAIGAILPFPSIAGITLGMSVSGHNIPAGTLVTSVGTETVTLSQPVSADVPSGTLITLTALSLGALLSTRRGNVGDLAASCANLETPIPLIDMVNECLEFMGAQATASHGVVYDSSADALAGHLLCGDKPCEDTERKAACHEPARIFAALPEYSTPATPVSANANVEPAVFEKLKVDFSSCKLPYSQALDVSRTYLRHFGSCRFEEMRTFRKCITEFVLDPGQEPTGFPSHVWRYPVRIDIAIEYLGITPEEYALLFQGAAWTPCGAPPSDAPPGRNPTRGNGEPLGGRLFGLLSQGGDAGQVRTVGQLSEFLKATCLSYCEFYELWKSEFVPFGRRSREGVDFPLCEPCCLDQVLLTFPGQDQQTDLSRLAIFIRLWQKLKASCCFCCSFAQLRDICDVLQLSKGAAINPDFVRQLAAFQMLRDQFCLPLSDALDPAAEGKVDADRSHLLALWVGPTAAKWGWAVRQLCEGIVLHARQRFGCEHRGQEYVETLQEKLDALSKLAGFDPASATDSWHALPTNTLRFAEVLAKIAASRFTIAEVLYLFTTDGEPDCGVFPAQEESEALERPLDLPDNECEFSLWRLRRELLAIADTPFSSAAEVRISIAADGDMEMYSEKGEGRHERLRLEAKISNECAEEWDWRRVAAALEEELGFASVDVLDLGRHFFPHVLQNAGYQVESASTRFVSKLPAAKTTPAMWGASGEGPLQYDTTSEELWCRVPLADHAVIAQLSHLQALNADEQIAVQDVYFQPRAMLALFALLFSDFPLAVRELIEEREACERWESFRRAVALCHHRCKALAGYLSRHVAAVTGQECPESEATALLILRELYGDENKGASDWEKDDGTEPVVAWTPSPNGGAFAALLGLVGTGLVVEYKAEGGGLAWRDVSGSISGFGLAPDRENAPVPTVLPSLDAATPPALSKFVNVRNGFLIKNAGGALLGGAQGFEVTWSGALLVDEEGPYEFWAGAAEDGRETPECDNADRPRWRVTLKRGSRTWVLLSHSWPAEEERRTSTRHLRRGAYELTIELVRPAPEFASENQVRPLETGLEVRYAGPDTNCERIAIPCRQLFSIFKDQTLGDGLTVLSPGAALYLTRHYTSTFRDIRRTYQRAFKALLFAHRLSLSGDLDCQRISELGYMLEEKARFAGLSYFKGGSGFTTHAANFDFNFLPVVDDYHAPTLDSRAKPSVKRMQAMFDWWERLFDYTVARDEVLRRSDRRMWHLFTEARAAAPGSPAPLLAQLGVDPRYSAIALSYVQAQSVAVYAAKSADMEDERWGVRVWHADRWLRALDCRFAAKDISTARPDLWASDDPAVLVAGEMETGNANLSKFMRDGCLENGRPRLYDELRRLNDGLRQRGRDALVAFLCTMDRVALPTSGEFATEPRDLSELLLLNVETGLCERASRIDEAICALQTIVRRARLHLVPEWNVGHGFARMWDREFATFHVWQACKRRHLYKENWIEWSDLEKARKVEAFRCLEENLRSSTLSVAVPGGAEWWPDERPPAHPGTRVLQQREPSALNLLAAPKEGLNMIGTPERDARPTWLAAVQLGDGSPTGAAPAPAGKNLPLWMEAAIQLGTRFYRIAAAGVPPAALQVEPHPRSAAEDCVACCEECGCCHADLVDEYYFWLVPAEVYEPAPVATVAGAAGYVATGDFANGYQDDFYDGAQQQSAVWQDPAQLPQLLAWQPKPAVRLAWCRIHNEEFQQPRRSLLALRVADSAGDLLFLGRMADSLTFSVTNGIVPDGHKDPSLPGFRYDLVSDDTVVLPEVVAAKAPATFLGTLILPVYPWFLFDGPGASLVPLSPFSPSLAVAKALRSHCRYEAALAWYRMAFDPLQQDCTWIDCSVDSGGQRQGDGLVRDGAGQDNGPVPVARGKESNGACCDSTDISCDQARDRSVVLQYLETLVEWSDTVMRRGDSPEAFDQARVILDVAERILGEAPRTVMATEASTAPKVSDFSPAFPSLNPRLLDLYETVAYRLENLRLCANAYRLRTGFERDSKAFFGDDPVRDGWRPSVTQCDEADGCFLRSPYRFMFLIQKAQEYASRVQELGTALTAAYEKGDAEYLSSLRAGQERELLTLGLETKKDMWREADWQIEALQNTKAVSQANLSYYTGMRDRGLINGELSYQALTQISTYLRGGGNALEAVGGAMSAAGNFFMGVAGFGGTPLVYEQLPIGEPLAFDFASAARILMGLAEIDGSTGALDLTESGWDRRLIEWNHQIDVLTIEIHQIERQILGLQRHRDQALQELNAYLRQIEQSQDVQSFLRDKFTAHDLYLYLQKETSTLHSKTYDLAKHAFLQAQYAFNLECGHTTRHFFPECPWDNLHEGLMAGEKLLAALRQMEKAYLDQNVREYELTKQFSLRLHFPAEYLRLRTTGYCEIDIPEWMFDVDFPGQYRRRIKNVSLTIPCVTGPYTGVHCKLTLLNSSTRIDPRLSAPPHECCCSPEPCCEECGEEERLAAGYRACPDDPRMVRMYGAREAVATSTGQNDAGLFQLDFNDPRYLPFEFMGGVSRWRISIPVENNYFERHTLTDVVLRLGVLAREGGPELRKAASAAARNRLPGDGWRFLDVRHEFPDAWHRFHECSGEKGRERRLRLRLERKLFPFIPGGKEIVIGAMTVVLAMDECEGCECPTSQGCPCPEHGRRASCTVEIVDGDKECEEASTVYCRRSDDPSNLYCGVAEIMIGPIGRKRRPAEIEFRFAKECCNIEQIFLLCRYSTGRADCGSCEQDVSAAHGAMRGM